MVTNNSDNISSAGLVKYDGSGTFAGVTVTQHDLLIGAASNGITSVAPSSTSGVPVISQGSSSDPVFGTAVVAGGGTGQTTLTNHGVLVGAATSAITQLAAGSAGQVLQSGGASADPAYSTATYPVTAGTSGNLLKSDGTNFVSSSAAGAGASLVLIQSQGGSGVGSVTFTTGITSTYANYLFVLSNVQSVTNNVTLELQVSSNAGSTYASTNYTGGDSELDTTTGTMAASTSTSFVYLCANLNNVQPNYDCVIWCYNVSNGQQSSYRTTGVKVGKYIELGASSQTSTTTVNAFKFLCSSGNIASGTFTLYGIKES